MIPPDYMGDAVYATDNGYGVTLTTEHHEPSKAGNTIVLEPSVIAALLRYVKRMEEHYKDMNKDRFLYRGDEGYEDAEFSQFIR